jgi:WD40 repeat protein
MSEKGNKIISLKFNHSNTLLYISTTQGFRILRIEDFKVISRRDRILSVNFIGGFKLIHPLHDSQKIALSGSPENSSFSSSTLVIWDEYQGTFLKTFEYPSKILNLSSRRSTLIVVLQSSIHLLRTSSFEEFLTLPTSENLFGCCGLSKENQLILAYPSPSKGTVNLQNIEEGSTRFLKIHENSILILTINDQGTLGASASELGTVIRVFNVSTLEILNELRRGSTSALITSLTFSTSSKYLASCSNKQTVHIWNIQNDPIKTSWLPSFLTYSKSDFQVKLFPEIFWTCEFSQMGASLCFTDDQKVYIAGLDGKIICYELVNEELNEKSSSWFLDFEEDLEDDESEWTCLE